MSSCNLDKLRLKSSAADRRFVCNKQQTGPCRDRRLHLSTALVWSITQRVLVIPCRRFGTSYRSIIQDSWPLKTGPICCPETSVRNHHHSLRNSPEERSSNLLRGGKQKSHKIGYICRYDKHILVQYVDGTLHNNRYCLRHRVLLPSGSERLWDPPNAVSQTVPLTYSIKSSMSSVQCSLF